MILLVVVASILIAAITIYQYNEQTEDYHQKRLERKEEAIKSAVTYELYHSAQKPLDTTSAVRIISEKINEISDIHNIDLNIYNLKGELIGSSNRISEAARSKQLNKEVLQKIRNNPGNREVVFLEPAPVQKVISLLVLVLRITANMPSPAVSPKAMPGKSESRAIDRS